jgi:hypothetical protein
MIKRVSILLVAIFLQVFFVQSAMADDRKPKVVKKVKDHKAWYFAVSPVYYLTAHMTIHEGSHALAGAINPNYQVSNFKPWPHFIDGGPHFVLGSVNFSCIGKACEDKTGMGVISVAPYITDTVLFTTADLLLSANVIKPNSVPGRVLYFAGMVVPWWDFSYNAVWANKISDANHIAGNFQIPLWSVMATGMSVSAVGLWRLWGGYKRAFPGKNSFAKESSLVIMPMKNSETVGISAGMRF